MDTVKIKKEKLLEIIRQNRKDHREIFISAQEKYREAAVALLDEQLAHARNRQPFRQSRLYWRLPPRPDQSRHHPLHSC